MRLTPEQEDRFRQTHLRADVSQARICILLFLVPIVGFLFNDYKFFGLSHEFYGLLAMRAALAIFSAWTLLRFRTRTDYRSFDRYAVAWAVVLTAFVIVVDATRPSSYLGHAILVVVTIFVFCLAFPNPFIIQIILSSVLTVGESVIILVAAPAPAARCLSILLGVWLTSAIALTAPGAFIFTAADSLSRWTGNETPSRPCPTARPASRTPSWKPKPPANF